MLCAVVTVHRWRYVLVLAIVNVLSLIAKSWISSAAKMRHRSLFSSPLFSNKRFSSFSYCLFAFKLLQNSSGVNQFGEIVFKTTYMYLNLPSMSSATIYLNTFSSRTISSRPRERILFLLRHSPDITSSRLRFQFIQKRNGFRISEK